MLIRVKLAYHRCRRFPLGSILLKREWLSLYTCLCAKLPLVLFHIYIYIYIYIYVCVCVRDNEATKLAMINLNIEDNTQDIVKQISLESMGEVLPVLHSELRHDTP